MEVPAYYLHPLHYERLKAWLGDALCHDATALVGDLKMVKSPAEIACIREASRIADVAMRQLTASLKKGQSELEAAGVVYGTLLGSGSGLAASTMNVVSGERSGFSHGAPTNRRFADGDSINVEYGATWKRYTATIGRQFCIGEPSPRLREVYAVVRQAADACIAAIRDGVPSVVPHDAAAKVIADAGLDRYRVHTSGYGLAPGFPPSWGEAVSMFGGNTYTLRAGMVLSVEPPVFIGPEKLGVRIIDNVLVTEKGCELLSTIERGLVCA
jgi:Xaa-Pro dipeptidase